jgi:Tfp pilus assembly protein PilP
MAIIQAPDGKIYQATINNRFGNHYGKIIAITPDHLEVEEQAPPEEAAVAGQDNLKRIVTLQLKGGS